MGLNAGPNCLKQASDPAVRWFLAYFRDEEEEEENASIMRSFVFRAFELPANKTIFILDSSPTEASSCAKIVAWTSTNLCPPTMLSYWSQSRCDRVSARCGVADIALCIARLVSEWRHLRSSWAVRDDEITINGTPALNLLAREMALDVASTAHRPVTADTSRVSPAPWQTSRVGSMCLALRTHCRNA